MAVQPLISNSPTHGMIGVRLSYPLIYVHALILNTHHISVVTGQITFASMVVGFALTLVYIFAILFKTYALPFYVHFRP